MYMLDCIFCEGPTPEWRRMCLKCEPKKLNQATNLFSKKFNVTDYSLNQPTLNFTGIDKNVKAFSRILLELKLLKDGALYKETDAQKRTFLLMCFEYICLFEYFNLIMKLEDDLEDQSTRYQLELAYLEITDFICESSLLRENTSMFFANIPDDSFDYTIWEKDAKKMSKRKNFDKWCHHEVSVQHIENCRSILVENIDKVYIEYKLILFHGSSNRLVNSFFELASLHVRTEVSIFHYFREEFDLINDGLTGIYSRISHPVSILKTSTLFTISRLMDISLAKFKYLHKYDLKNVTMDLNHLSQMGLNILQLNSSLPSEIFDNLRTRFLKSNIYSSFIIKSSISTAMEMSGKLLAKKSEQIIYLNHARDVSRSIIHYSSASKSLQKYVNDASCEDDPVQKYLKFLKFLDDSSKDNQGKPGLLCDQVNFSEHTWILDQEYVIASYQIKHNLINLFMKLSENKRLSATSRYSNYTDMKKGHYRLYKLLGIETKITEKGKKGAPIDILFTKQNIKNKNNLIAEKQHLVETFQDVIRKVDSIIPPVIAPPVTVLVIFDHLLQFTRCSFSVFEPRDYFAFELFIYHLSQYTTELRKSEHLDYSEVMQTLELELSDVLKDTNDKLFSKQDVNEIQLILSDVFSAVKENLHFPPSCGLLY